MNTTPGPWIVSTSNYAKLEHASIVVKKADSPIIIAVVGMAGKADSDTYMADAVLMSIAPEMLEALIAIQEAARMNILDAESVNGLISDVLAKLANEAGVQ